MPSSCLSAMHLGVFLASPNRARHLTPLAGQLLRAALFVGQPYNVPEGDPAYLPKLDRDNDGFACES